MKINLKKLGNGALKLATPLVIAAVVTKASGGKVNLKNIALDTLAAALEKRETERSEG